MISKILAACGNTAVADIIREEQPEYSPGRRGIIIVNGNHASANDAANYIFPNKEPGEILEKLCAHDTFVEALDNGNGTPRKMRVKDEYREIRCVVMHIQELNYRVITLREKLDASYDRIISFDRRKETNCQFTMFATNAGIKHQHVKLENNLRAALGRAEFKAIITPVHGITDLPDVPVFYVQAPAASYDQPRPTVFSGAELIARMNRAIHS